MPEYNIGFSEKLIEAAQVVADTQYRSATFYVGEEQRRTAEEVIRTVDASGGWKAKIVTEVVPFREFWRAEEYHQKYLVKYPQGYTCHYIRRMDMGE